MFSCWNKKTARCLTGGRRGKEKIKEAACAKEKEEPLNDERRQMKRSLDAYDAVTEVFLNRSLVSGRSTRE